MSNGARLAAVLVVVAVAAIGLFFAISTPSTPPRNPEAPVDSLKAPEPVGGLGEATGEAALQADAGTVPPPPPPEAFGVPSGVPAPGTTAPAPVAPVQPATEAAAASKVAVPAIPTVPAAKEAAPVGTEYVIKSGDTLEGIARAQLGDGQKWRLIEKLNPGLNPKQLKPGQRIMLPAGTEVKAAEASSGQQGAKVTPAANTYTVQKGDTLVAIARKFYGSDGEWKRILEANASVLKGNADALQPGMKLSIPPKR